MKCAQKLTPGHRCDGNGIRDHIIGRMKKGVLHTHIITEFITELEQADDRSEDNHIENAGTHDENDIHFIESLLNDPTK